MYLEKLEIQGFKSFANKNVLKFPASAKATADKGVSKRSNGITAIVGPNGSGKSNIADAVRWVLGEQSLKLLRGKKSEDVIFSGSSKKSSLSFAEVSLYLNNEDKKAPVDYREVVITRRLYRDGESEYLLNNSKVRLLDISLLLAKARFGQRAYSVIGQGMVENFLNTSITERKEFFDEATGVKMYQIKRDDAANKLRGTRENLDQAETLLNEIEPRMRSLTRQIKKLEQRAEIEKELNELQIRYYSSGWHQLNNELKEINKKLINEEQDSREKEKELNLINKKLEDSQLIEYNNPAKLALESDKNKLEEDKNSLGQVLAEIKAKINVSYEAGENIDLAWLNKRQGQLEQEQKNEKEKAEAKKKLNNELKTKLEKTKKEQNETKEKIIKLRDELTKNQTGNTKEDNKIKRIKTYIDELDKINQDIFQALENDNNISKIKQYFIKLKDKVLQLRKETTEEQEDNQIPQINNKIAELENDKNELVQSYIELNSKIIINENEINYLNNSVENKKKEIIEITEKLNKNKNKDGNDVEELAKEQAVIEKQIKKIDEELNNVKKKINDQDEENQHQREQIIKLQTRAHELQLGFNEINNKINEVKINKARVETKLEDLEQEIRQEMNSLRAIIDNKNVEQNINKQEAKDKIYKLKHQLELIGGIDPEVQKEYTETNTRYEFLSSQVEDLNSGMKNLEKVITELDKTIAEKFDSAFNEIAKQFEKYFKVLFNGGSSKLIKYMEDVNADKNKDEDEENLDIQPDAPKGVILRKTKQVLSGIEIQATPPGKKIKNISMLSGGERALTAIALICAIISVNPSPFVVLDEVDAALDEANSGRLGKILEELSSKTQFIVVTHNRSMMYIADIIYGVTMGDDSISKLLSIKIDEVATHNT